MKAHFIAVIPQDPRARFAPDRLSAMQTLLAKLCRTDETRIKDFGERLQFIDCGDNPGAIFCPTCAAELDLTWWGQRMDHAWDADQGFYMCGFETPCCGATTRLDGLDYRPAQGFATWFVSARQTKPAKLTQSDQDRLTTTAGQPLRFVYQTYA
jgi:hypothetical protein